MRTPQLIRCAAGAALVLLLSAGSCQPTTAPTTDSTPLAPEQIIALAAERARTDAVSSIELTRDSADGSSRGRVVFRKGEGLARVDFDGGDLQLAEYTPAGVASPWSFTFPAASSDIDRVADAVGWSCRRTGQPQARIIALPDAHRLATVSCEGQPIFSLVDGIRVDAPTGPAPVAALDTLLGWAQPVLGGEIGGLTVKADGDGVSGSIRAGSSQGGDGNGQPFVLGLDLTPSGEVKADEVPSPHGVVPAAQLSAGLGRSMWEAAGSPTSYELDLQLGKDPVWLLQADGEKTRVFGLDGTPRE